MNKKCPPSPIYKKEYITNIGRILINTYGKKKFYQPKEVKEAAKKSKHNSYQMDWSCWAMCIFTSHSDFNHHHYITGEVCDYLGMRTEMIGSFASLTPDNWTEIPGLDIETCWLNFDDVFGTVLEGIGSFIGGIFDGT